MRVVVADDSTAYRIGLRQVLDTIPGVTVIAEASNGVDALRVVHETAPDLLILDLHMPHLSGTGVLRELQATGNGVRVLLHSGYADEHFGPHAIRRGAAAFVPKGNVQLLIDTLHHLMQH